MTPNLRSGDAVGSYGETLRLDLNGDYGDLGANLQSVNGLSMEMTVLIQLQ